MNIEDGWVFYSADFSNQASSDPKSIGHVMLKRNIEESKKWHSLSDETKESDDCPELYVSGRGLTFEGAMINANMAAAHARPIKKATITGHSLTHWRKYEQHKRIHKRRNRRVLS